MQRSIEVWAHGLAAVFIGGGAGAVTTVFTAPMFAPNDLNVGGHPWKLLGLAMTTFIITGFFSAMGYLKQSPLPPLSDGQA